MASLPGTCFMPSTMKQLARRTLPLFGVFSAVAAVAQAHPGHEGHEGSSFTWDFSHLTSHPLATLVYLALLAVAVWAVRTRLRSRRSLQAQSLPKSTAR